MDELKNKIAHILSQLQFGQKKFDLIKLAGQASYREYYRITFEGSGTLIVMKMPTGFSCISEEVTKSDKQINELPFINVQKYLKELGIPVPNILAYDVQNGILILEDIGDRSLESAVKNANDEFVVFFYTKAIELLIRLQSATRENKSEQCIAFHKKFDETLLNWEFAHFREYGIEDRLQIKMAESDRKLFEEITGDITNKIVTMPTGFTHRDFQSRNIHIHNYDCWLIDFQDALVGPVVYDLVALLRDSYIPLKPEILLRLQKIYVEKTDEAHPYHSKLDQLIRDFNLQTIQRKLKDAGRFQFIKTVKNNPSFMVSVAPSLSYVKQALDQVPEYDELNKLLGKYLTEFR